MGIRNTWPALCLLAACSNGSAQQEPVAALPAITHSPLVKVAPAGGYPAAVTFNHSANNLDIIEHEGRFYFAFRTAPNHFASEETELYIVSSTEKTDPRTWDFEARFHFGTDLREPRFFAWKDTLYLYFASLGSNPTAFEPGQMYRTEQTARGEWSTPVTTFEPGFIPWRIKWFGAKPIMTGYTGGENIYNFTGELLDVYLLTTDNGTDWKPLNPERPVVLRSGGSETDIEFDDERNLYAIVRNEAGDDTGFGAHICHAPKEDITDWTCTHDPKKYDSPLLLKHGSEIYLIARRNVTETGHYDLGRDDLLDYAGKIGLYQLEYWTAPKRCSMWHFNRAALRIDFLLDFPSRGDTCFPSIVWQTENEFLLYNYSNDIDGPDVTWRQGQLGDTFIYSTVVSFEIRD